MAGIIIFAIAWLAMILWNLKGLIYLLNTEPAEIERQKAVKKLDRLRKRFSRTGKCRFCSKTHGFDDASFITAVKEVYGNCGTCPVCGAAMPELP